MISQLKELGLSEKEAKVYLASLELGESTAQEIAKQTNVNRPTTYVQIENLTKMGLMSSIEKGKKHYFAASSPEQALRLLDKQRMDIEEKTKEFKKILPELKSIFDLGQTKEKPRVKFFEGKEGIKAMQEEFKKTKIKTLNEITLVDESAKINTQVASKIKEKLVKEKVKRRTIYTSKEGPILPLKEQFLERRFVPLNKFPFSIEMGVYGNKVAIASLRGKIIGVIIESKEITDSLRSFFDLAWEGAKRYQK